MRGTQQQFLDEFQRITEAASLTFVHDTEWANTGRVYAKRGFHTVLAVKYSFQDGYASIYYIGPDGPMTVEQLGMKVDLNAWPALAYLDEQRWLDMFSQMESDMEEGK